MAGIRDPDTLDLKLGLQRRSYYYRRGRESEGEGEGDLHSDSEGDTIRVEQSSADDRGGLVVEDIDNEYDDDDDDDETLSEHSHRPPPTFSTPSLVNKNNNNDSKLIRNSRIDGVDDYLYNFSRLQLKRDHHARFLHLVREYRGQQDVRKVLENPWEDVRVLSEDFLRRVGGRVWGGMRDGRWLDERFRNEGWWTWKGDQESLCRLLDELWNKIRILLWSPASMVVVGSRSKRRRQTNNLSDDGADSTTVSSLGEEERATAARFFGKLRRDFGLPPPSRERVGVDVGVGVDLGVGPSKRSEFRAGIETWARSVDR